MRPNKCLYFNLSSSPGTAPATPCCKQLARAGQEHYDQFWNLLDGRVDGYNLDAGAFQSDVFKWSTQTNTAPKVATIPILDPTWNGTTTGGTSGGGGGSSGGYLRRKSSVGLEGVVDASDATNGRICVLDKDYLSSQIISLIPQDPASFANPGGTYKTPLGTTTIDTGGNFDVIVKRNSVTGWTFTTSKSTTPFQIVSTLADGTKPFDVTSTTVNTNLNADRTDGVHIAALSNNTIPKYTTAGTQLTDAAIQDDGINVAITLDLVVTKTIKVRANTANDGVLTHAITAGRTWTFPDFNIIVAGSTAALTSGKVPRASTAGILVDGTLSDDGTNPSATLFKATTLQAKDTDGLKLAESGGTVRFTANGTGLAFFAGTPVAQQASAALTNNVTGGGDNDVIADYSSLTIYATDAAAIRNNLYQLARKVKEIGDALRTGKYNLLS